jgi:NAD(P)-dependent dehydrogenase (short-subunit alcohol dehydrogenase family)
MASSLQGRATVVTGAASGIGFETARLLAQRGARVALLDVDEAGAAEAAERCGAEAFALGVDVRDPASVEQAVAEVADRLGSLDVVLANAGVGRAGVARFVDPDQWEDTVFVNLFGVWRTARAALPHLIASKGYLLLTGSLAAGLHTPAMSAYSASKAGVEALGDVLRLELAHLGVDVGVAYYSWIRTPMVVEAERKHPEFARLRAGMRPPFNRMYAVERAAAATVDGIERRAAKVVYPRWVGKALALRGALARAARADALRAVPELDRLAAHEAAAAEAERARV